MLANIDFTIPPFFSHKQKIKGKESEEPYTELGDYLDKNDFSNLLDAIGQFAGKTGSGLINFGEQILN